MEEAHPRETVIEGSEGEGWLVQLTGREAGRKVVVGGLPMRIGREPGSQLRLEHSAAVSRRHALITREGSRFWLEDLGSTNGTYLNEFQIAHRVPLGHRDIVRIAGRSFQFLCEDLERSFDELIYSLAVLDRDTQLYKERYLLEELDRELPRAQRFGQPLSLFIIELDHYELLDAPGSSEHSAEVLRQFIERVQSFMKAGDCLARLGPHRLGLLAPASDEGAALTLAESLRLAMSESPFGPPQEPRQLSATIGYVTSENASLALSGTEVLRQAELALARGTALGRNRAMAFQRLRSNQDILVQPARQLLAHLTRTRAPGEALMLEVADEARILADWGSHTFKRWTYELFELTDRLLLEGEYIGLLEDRAIVVFLSPDAAPERRERLLESVRNAFGRRDTARGSAHAFQRTLSVAAASADQLAASGERLLDILRADLMAQRLPSNDESRPPQLPFPLAAARSRIASSRGGLVRLKAIVDAIEVTLRFTTAVGFALVREERGDAAIKPLAKLLGELGTGPLSMGHWCKLSLQMVQLLPETGKDPWSRALRRLLSDSGRREALNRVTHIRNRSIGHGSVHPELEYDADARACLEVLDELHEGLAFLSAGSLISLAEIISTEEDEGGSGLLHFGYSVYRHDGDSDHFPVTPLTTVDRLDRGWCHLQRPGGIPSLSLAPFFGVSVCDLCQDLQVVMAERFVVGARGVPVETREIVRVHTARLQLPASSFLRRLSEELEARG